MQIVNENFRYHILCIEKWARRGIERHVPETTVYSVESLREKVREELSLLDRLVEECDRIGFDGKTKREWKMDQITQRTRMWAIVAGVGIVSFALAVITNNYWNAKYPQPPASDVVKLCNSRDHMATIFCQELVKKATFVIRGEKGDVEKVSKNAETIP